LKLTASISSNNKVIGTISIMLVKHFKSRVVVGHWYPIVSIDFHEHAMPSIMVLRQGYALVFGPFDARKHFQGMDRPG